MSDLIFIMYERNFGWNLIRSLFSWLDSVAYTLFSWVMQLIFDIAEVSTSDAFNGFYDDIQSRIYALLAIYMLFKITISMLTYLVNPDSINDKSSGVGKLSIRIVTSLVMLIAFPMAFDFLKTVQPHIMEALPRVILASDVGNTDLGGQMENVGKNIAFQTYNGVFFNTNCADLADSGICFLYGNTVDIAVEHINDEVPGDKSSYKYDYMPLIGFVVALVMTLILLGYCVDVAIRVFKLIILQLIAPIPIISYMDPKSSKDGAFNKWIKMVISVWADLFIKLAVVYFIMLVISELFTSGAIANLTGDLFGENVFRGGLVTLALIVGLLFFAKDAPKFICDAMGIKMSENGKLFGGLGKIMAAGAIGAGTIGSAIASGRASWMADAANDKKHHVGNIMKNVGAGILGGIGGARAGASAAISAKDHHTKAAMDAMAKRNATALAAGDAGSTAFGRALSMGSGLLFGETLAASGKRNIANMEASKSALEAVKSRASGEMVKKDWTYGALGSATDTDVHGNSIGNVNYKDFLSRMNAAKTRGDDTVNFYDEQGNALEVSMEYAEKQLGFLQKNNESSYIEKIVSGSAPESDDTLTAMIVDAEAKTPGLTIRNRNDVNDNIEKQNRDIIKAKRENAHNEQNDRFSGKSS